MPYFHHGDIVLAGGFAACAKEHQAILLTNHDPVVTGKDLSAPVEVAEKLEETTKLRLLLCGGNTGLLTTE